MKQISMTIQQMVTGTPCKPEPIIPKKKYCTWNASGSHKQALCRIKVVQIYIK